MPPEPAADHAAADARSADSSAPDPQGSSTLATLATVLRGAMHLAFAVLVSLGVLRAVTVDEVGAPLALGAGALVAAVYGVGSALAHRRRADQHADRPEGERGGERAVEPADECADERADRAVSAADLLLPSPGWAIALLAAWVAATVVSSAFVWIAFPLFFLVLFSLGRATGVLALLLVAAWAVLAPLVVGPQSSLSLGEVLGPLVGAVFSLVAHTVWRRLLEETERTRQLLERLHAAQADLADSERRKGVAEERQRLAQDLHDTLAQGLNSIVLLSRSARAAHPAAAADFSRIEDTARENLADARDLVRDLAARRTEDGLEELLRTVIGRAERQGTGTGFELRRDGEPRPLPPATVETLHRAAQSLVANVLRHAAAERCVLTVAWWPDRVSLDVVDDGRGFDPTTAAPRRDGGDGLALLHSRIARAGGEVTLESAPGEGTAVGISLPTTRENA